MGADMSKEEWFAEFERLEAEHPEKSDAELSDMAHEAMVERQAVRADHILDEMKHGDVT